MKKRISIFLVAVFLLATLVTGFHHHDDSADYSADCSICLFAHHNTFFKDSGSVEITRPERNLSPSFLEDQPKIEFLTAKDLSARAPPENL